MINNFITRRAALTIIPVIMFFAIYIQFHGDLSPGGGFQAGVILATIYLVIAAVFRIDNAKKFMSTRSLQILMSVGVMLYVGTGFATLFLGSNFLEYAALSHHITEGQHYGLFTIELGVGITVFASMCTIINMFFSELQNHGHSV